jgi:hypothetical protein
MTTARRRRGEAMYLEVMTVPPDLAALIKERHPA